MTLPLRTFKDPFGTGFGQLIQGMEGLTLSFGYRLKFYSYLLEGSIISQSIINLGSPGASYKLFEGQR